MTAVARRMTAVARRMTGGAGRGRETSCEPAWSSFLVVGWSLAYTGLAVTGRHADILTTPVVVALGALGVAVSAVMAVAPPAARHGPGRAGLTAFAWGTVVALCLPSGSSPAYQAFCVVGGVLWACGGLVFQRRSRNACVRCGRPGRPWATPVMAARWGATAFGIVVAIPLGHAVDLLPGSAGQPRLVGDVMVPAGVLPLPTGTPVALVVWVVAVALVGYARYLCDRGSCARCGGSG